VKLAGLRYPGFEARVLLPIELKIFAEGPVAEVVQP